MKIKRGIFIVFGVIFLILFLSPYAFAGIINAGNTIGILAGIVFLIYGVWAKNIDKKIKCFWKKTYGRWILSVVAAVLAVLMVFFVIITFRIIDAAHNPPEEDSTVVVLGCQVKEWGPSLMLAERLEACYDYLSENESVKCVLSGGKGDDEPMSEALAMYEWLVDRGIDESRLYIEDRSTSTRENLEFSKEIIEKEGLNPNITIITNEFHQYRAAKIAKSMGIKSFSVSGSTHPILFPTYFVRELGGALFEAVVHGNF